PGGREKIEKRYLQFDTSPLHSLTHTGSPAVQRHCRHPNFVRLHHRKGPHSRRARWPVNSRNTYRHRLTVIRFHGSRRSSLIAPPDELNPGPVSPTMTGLSVSQRNEAARSSAIWRASSFAFAFASASTYPMWQTPPGPSRVTTSTRPLADLPTTPRSSTRSVLQRTIAAKGWLRRPGWRATRHSMRPGSMPLKPCNVCAAAGSFLARDPKLIVMRWSPALINTVMPSSPWHRHSP